MKVDIGFFDINGNYKEDIQEVEMLSIEQINLLQGQNEGLKKQNAELQRENAILKEENYNKLIAWEELQADNEQLKKDKIGLHSEIKQLEQEIAELKAENERLKEENYQLQKDCQICENFIDFIPCKPIRDMDYDLQKVINQRDKYIQTLQEIKAIVCGNYEIIDPQGRKDIIKLITKAEEE